MRHRLRARFWISCAFIVVAGLFLSACETRPRKTTTRGMPVKTVQVAVIPPDGQPKPMSRLLAKSVADALIRIGYDAQVSDSTDNRIPSEFTISGRSENLDEIHAPTIAALYWTLSNKSGLEIAYLTQGVRGKTEDWDYGSPALLRMVGEQAASDFSPFLGPRPQGDEIQEPIPETIEKIASSGDLIPAVSNQKSTAPLPTAPPPQDENRNFADIGVWVDDVTGAPGNGNSTLTRALILELERAALPFAITVGTASHFVQGIVDVSVVDAITEHVSIIWIVSDSAGNEIGRIKQNNDVPRGTLHQNWGDTARYAAIGGADAVLSIVEQDLADN